MKTSKVLLFFTKVCLRMSLEYCNAYKFHFLKGLFEGNFIETLLIQSKIYSLFWSDNRSELDTPFPIKYFSSICGDLISFDVTLPLSCRCGRFE